MAAAEPEDVSVEPLPDLEYVGALQNIHDPEHWINYIWNLPENGIAFKVLDTGIPLMDFLRCPTQRTESFEWLAFVIHALIDRVSIFYDFVVLRCNDGYRDINFAEPLFYGSEITLAGIDRGSKNRLLSDNDKCSHRIKIGDNECFLSEAETIEDFPLLSFPTKQHDGQHSMLGASSYIQTMITKLKAMRENVNVFPRSVDYYVSPTFEGVTRYILFHLTIIMSHITACHFKEIADQKLNRHLFTLNAWIFSIGVHHDFLPSTASISSEFVFLCRHLLYVDAHIDRLPRPEIPPIPIEGIPELPEEVSDESGSSNTSNYTKTNAKKVKHANTLGEDIVLAPEAMDEE